jgi:single-strand DNA-binding protein
MARSLNKCTIIGNVGRDPEMRYTPQGTAVTSFTVAVNRSRPARDGMEAQEQTDWFRVTTWNKLAEIANQYLTKGTLVYLEGRVELDEWTGNDNQHHARLGLVANDMVMLSAKGEMATAGVGAGAGYANGNGRDEAFGGGDMEPDDIPF